jgi:hypothetical protein
MTTQPVSCSPTIRSPSGDEGEEAEDRDADRWTKHAFSLASGALARSSGQMVAKPRARASGGRAAAPALGFGHVDAERHPDPRLPRGR